MSRSFSSILSSAELLRSIPWKEPLPVQYRTMEPILSGKNVAIRSRTGSGKTAAYVLPLLDRMFSRPLDQLRIVFLAPTRELCAQIETVLDAFDAGRTARLCSSSSGEGRELIVCTPGKFRGHANVIVIDEADLVIGMECANDLSSVTCEQLVLVSATLTEADTSHIFRLIFGQAAVPCVHVHQHNALPEQLEQFRIDCKSDQAKFTLTVALLKLRVLAPPPILIFTASTNRSYRLRLVLEKFGLKCLTLNCELPRQCQAHTIDQFNRGCVDILICTDEEGDQGHVCPRGLDFRALSYVLNFDCPTSTNQYVHRVGRACRLHASGAALTLVATEREFETVAELTKVKAFLYPEEQVNAFQYRVRDALRIASKIAIKRARAHEIREEMIANERLKQVYFAQNQHELRLLKDCSKRVQPLLKTHSEHSMKNVPPYLLPPKQQTIHHKTTNNRKKRRANDRKNRKTNHNNNQHKNRSCDPFNNTKRAISRIVSSTDNKKKKKIMEDVY